MVVSPLVIVNPLDVNCIAVFKLEDGPPVGANGHSPITLLIAFELVQRQEESGFFSVI
jgi:hypothetical protein